MQWRIRSVASNSGSHGVTRHCLRPGASACSLTFVRDLGIVGKARPSDSRRTGQIRRGRGFSASSPGPAESRSIIPARAEPGDQQCSAEASRLRQCAIEQLQLGGIEQALSCYEELISLGEATAVDLSNAASLCNQLNRFADAERLARLAIAADPEYPNPHNLLGNALFGQGRLREAMPCLDRAVALKPENPNYHYNLGNLLQRLGDLRPAIEAYRQALALCPNHVESLNNLGNAWNELGDMDEAIRCYTRILQCRPGEPQAESNLALALAIQGDVGAGESHLEQLLQLNPDFPGAHNNLGLLQEMRHDLAGAMACYRKALELWNDHPEAQKNLGMAELLHGDYTSGWKRYAFRFACDSQRSILHAHPKCPPLQSPTLQPGDSLLLVSEQGLGDCLQFMRYVLAFRQYGIAVRLCAPAKLHHLIRLSQIDAEPLTPEQANHVSTGQWLPLLSAAQVLGVSPSNPFICEPYLRTSPELVAKWRQHFAQEPRPLIGIHWQGNPEHERSTSRGRSLPLEAFACLVERTPGALVSLQKGFGAEQRQTCSFQQRFVRCQALVDDTWDFAETAAIIANCDLVITSDSGLAHLAGGLGHPTWLLLKHIPEWRWGLEGERSFWYPSMRLFRQPYPGGWNALMECVAAAL